MFVVKSELPTAKFVPWKQDKLEKTIAYLEDHELTHDVDEEVKLLSYHDLYMLVSEVKLARKTLVKLCHAALDFPVASTRLLNDTEWYEYWRQRARTHSEISESNDSI